MNKVIEWLSSYGAEYDVVNRILTIKKPMYVGDFVALKKILRILNKVDDIRIEESKYDRRKRKEI